MLDRLKGSFIPDDERANALLTEVTKWTEAIHGVEGRAEYYFAIEELVPGVNGIHDRGFEVVINSGARNRVLAGIHELGHVLDAVFLNSVQLGGSPSDPPFEYATDIAEELEATDRKGTSLLCSWLAKVRTSQYHQNLKALSAAHELPPSLAVEVRKLLKVRELWARSYELFVCRRHPGSSLAHEIDVECMDSVTFGGFTAHNYWQGDDFNGVESEIETVFRRLGWLIT